MSRCWSISVLVVCFAPWFLHGSKCGIDDLWSTYLNIVPLPNGNSLWENRTYFIACKKYGETFVNKVYEIPEITQKEVYETGAVQVTCLSNGTITPNFFNETYDWCRKGCVKIPETEYTIKYPEGLNRSDPLLTPVAPVEEEILLECAPGYVQAVGDSGKQKVKCEPSGSYNEYLINCVEGCDYPIDETGGSTISSSPSYLVGEPPFAIGTKVKVDCRGSTSSKEIICRKETGWEGLQELSCKRQVVSALGLSKANFNTIHTFLLTFVIIYFTF